MSSRAKSRSAPLGAGDPDALVCVTSWKRKRGGQSVNRTGGSGMSKESILLKPGDSCPICGRPIKTEDPEMLLFLSKLAEFMEEKKDETD